LQKESFLEQENWHGSYYELAIEYCPVGDDQQLLKAVQAFSEIPCLTSLWFERTSFGGPPDMLQSLERFGGPTLYGLLEVDQSQRIGCLLKIIREQDGSDWLDFSIPTGMLELVFDVDYPLLVGNNPWIPQVDQILLDIAEAVYQSSPFNLAIIGEEVSGFVTANKITPDYLERGGYIVPQDIMRRFRQVPPSVRLNDDLQWFPIRE
jgi:hypothetical protein